MSHGAQSNTQRWLCFDVGETLVDETRMWGEWADQLGVPRLTFFAVLGAAIARDEDHQTVLRRFGGSNWWNLAADVEAAYGGFRADDLYPDALRCLERVRSMGYRVAVVANQPASRTRELVALGVRADVVAMSEDLGVFKPSLDFYERIIALVGVSDPSQIVYVGDRVDNDVLPAMTVGMRTVWLRRGPWGVLQALPSGVVPLIVQTLAEFPDRLREWWPPVATP